MTLTELTDRKKQLAETYSKLLAANTEAKARKKHDLRRGIVEEMKRVELELNKIKADISRLSTEANDDYKVKSRRLVRDLLFMMRDVGFPCSSTRATAKELAMLVFGEHEDAYKNYAFEEIEL